MREGGGRKKTVKKKRQDESLMQILQQDKHSKMISFLLHGHQAALNLFLQTAVGSSLYTTGHLSPLRVRVFAALQEQQGKHRAWPLWS